MDHARENEARANAFGQIFERQAAFVRDEVERDEGLVRQVVACAVRECQPLSDDSFSVPQDFKEAFALAFDPERKEAVLDRRGLGGGPSGARGRTQFASLPPNGQAAAV